MKILVLGGNRFLGYYTMLELLKERLFKEEHEITTLNRSGNRGLFGNKVEEILCDRNSHYALKTLEGRDVKNPGLKPRACS